MAKKMASKSTNSDFEVAATPGMGSGSTAESFGGAPGATPVGGGTMAKFGHRAKGHSGQGVWPEKIVSPDVKTGYPKGFDNRKASARAAK